MRSSQIGRPKGSRSLWAVGVTTGFESRGFGRALSGQVAWVHNSTPLSKLSDQELDGGGSRSGR